MASQTVNIIQGAARSATYNMVLQVSFRLLTFVMNAVILRHISKEVLGIVNVRLALLYSTSLFLSREAFRKACLSTIEKEKNWKQIVNVIWLCLPFGFIFSVLLCVIWIFLLEWPSQQYQTLYVQSVIVFAISASVELTTEPMYIVGQQYLFIRSRVIIEGLALASKCLCTVIVVLFLPTVTLNAFCAAQIVHSLVLIFGYYSFYFVYLNYYPKEKAKIDFPFFCVKDFFPNFGICHRPSLVYIKLVISFLTQSVLKQFLTEGERYVMTLFRVLTLSQQGVYDVINNLGSLAARFVFLPIEESYYTLFSQVLVRGKSVKEQDPTIVGMSATILSSVLKFVILLGVTIVSYGYAYAFLALNIYGGETLSSSEGPILLRWYCFYVLVIAVNGITECFMFALMSKQEVDSYNTKMLSFSLVFLGSALVLTNLVGSVGFILANCLNMGLRIFQSTKFIQSFYSKTDYQPLMDAVPKWQVLVVFAVSFLVTAASEQMFCCKKGILFMCLHVAVGCCCLLGVGLTLLLTEKDFLHFLWNQWTGKLKLE